MVGVRGNRSIQDEKLLAAIFSTTRTERPLSAISSPTPEREDSGSSKETINASLDGDLQRTNAEALEDAVIARLRGDGEEDKDWPDADETGPRVYGAQQRNMIVDARPTVNAYAMQAVGLGSENMDNYKFATKAYLGIDNIHVMRDSLQKVIDTLKDSDLTPLGPNKEALHKSNWLKHIANMLEGVGLITRQVALQHSHVLIHCSDGWDRTSQLSSLSQICLDPYYRTIDGFIVLVEKDWLSFGHMFKHRSGFLSSEKWFQIENERIGGRSTDDTDETKQTKDALAGAQKTFENAFLSAKGFFTKQHNDSKESLNVDSDAEAGQNYDSESQIAGKRAVSVSAAAKEDKAITKVKETSPVFHQFLDATYQLMYQHPTRFEFTERFLKRLLYHLYSCQYGTFLLDNEKARKEAKLSERTKSVWDYFLARKQEFLNPKYDAEIDDNVRGKERLIFPRTDDVRWWNEVFGRTDEEMNGKTLPIKIQLNGASDGESEMSSYGQMSNSAPISRSRTPVLTGVETSEASVGVASPPKVGVHPDIGIKAENPQEDKVLPLTSGEAPAATNGQPVSEQLEEAQSTTVDVPVQQPDSAALQEQVHDDALADLPEGLDPLGIGDVKDHVPQAKRAQERRRDQVEALLQ
jgi:myotubularin-related protein 6/7/8